MSPTRWPIGALLGLVLTAPCPAQHIDVQIQVVNGRLNTGRIDLTQPGNPIDPSWRVFEARFGEIPNYTDDPGFNASTTSGIPANTLISFNILDAVRKWNATAQSFDDIVPAAITMQLGGAVFVDSPPGCNQFQSGFTFAQAGAAGNLHQHLGYILNLPAASGVYLLKLELVTDHPAVLASDPFWIVFSQNDIPNRAIAASYVRSLVGPPTCPGDANADNLVNGADLSVLLANFGACTLNGSGADSNDDGVINGADLSVLLANFGSAC